MEPEVWSDIPLADTASRVPALQDIEEGPPEDDDFVVIEVPENENRSSVDVYLGGEKHHLRLPEKLARGLTSILPPTSNIAAAAATMTTSAYEAFWKEAFGGSWLEKAQEGDDMWQASEGNDSVAHTTGAFHLPELQVDIFNTFIAWVKCKKLELTKSSESDAEPGARSRGGQRAKTSIRALHEELWTVMGDYTYHKSVRVTREGVETDSDQDDDVGKEHGGGYYPAFYPEGPKPRREHWQYLETWPGKK